MPKKLIFEIENIIAKHLPYDGECREDLKILLNKIICTSCDNKECPVRVPHYTNEPCEHCWNKRGENKSFHLCVKCCYCAYCPAISKQEKCCMEGCGDVNCKHC